MKDFFEKTKKKLEEIKSKENEEQLEEEINFPEFILGLIAIIMSATVLSAFVMRCLGAEFTSLGGMVVFFTFFIIVSINLSIIMAGLIGGLVVFQNLDLTIARIMYVFLSTAVSIIVFYWADYFIASVTITPSSVLVVSFLLALITCGLVDDSFDGI